MAVPETLFPAPSAGAAAYRERQILLALAAIFLVKLVVATTVPLVPDETYYLLWAQAPAFGYLDHPPFIALFIRAGTLLFGETPIGVRLLSALATLPTSWLVWQTANRVVDDPRAGPVAALVFNLTLYGFFGLAVATPDAPLTLFSAAMFYFIVRIVGGATPRDWVGLGIATGLALQSKYSALLLAAGLCVGFLIVPKLRQEWRRPGLYMAAAIAILIFAPNLAWNAAHGWATFLKQGGRVVDDPQFAPQFLLDFAGSQLGLFTPLLLVLAVVGLWRGTFRQPEAQRVIAAAILVPVAYFAFHALRARVQGNWPGFLYPALAVSAAAALLGGRAMPARLREAAIGVAAAFLLLAALDAVLAPFSALGRADPVERMARGWAGLADQVDALAGNEHVSLILTENYQLNAELRHFIGDRPVLQWNERDRPGAITDALAGSGGSALLVTTAEAKTGLPPGLALDTDLGLRTRQFRGVPIERYAVARVSMVPH